MMLMNVRMLKPTSVTPTLCVRTLKDPTSVAASKDMKGTAGIAQVLVTNSVVFNVR